MSDLPKLEFFFKGFPEDVRFRRHTVPDSLEYARGTMYEAWYRCLKSSPYTQEALALNEWRSVQQRHTYELFGNLQGTTFDTWWVERGYQLFSEKGEFKKIEIQQQACEEDNVPKLVLEIPLTVSPATLRRQFDELLDKHHPEFKRFDRWAHSTAEKPLRNSKLTSVSLNLYISVYEAWDKNHDATLYSIGEQLALDPRNVVKRGDTDADIREKHLKMALVVSEYLGKAKNLIAYASEGIFPFTENHNWVERSTRAANWRHE